MPSDYCAVADCERTGFYELEHGGHVCAMHGERMVNGTPMLAAPELAQTPGERFIDALIELVDADDARIELKQARDKLLAAARAVYDAPDGTEDGTWNAEKIRQADERFRKRMKRAVKAFKAYERALAGPRL